MKPNTKIILGVSGLLAATLLVQRAARSDRTNQNTGACCPLVAMLDTKPLVSSTNQIKAIADSQTVAFYFHGTVRCETCLKIEQQARAVIEQQFGAKSAFPVAFKSVNYDLPESAHFLQDYKLPCPSLVLFQKKNGGEEKWKLLGDTWQLIEAPAKFDRYVAAEVKKFLFPQKSQTETNRIESSSASM